MKEKFGKICVSIAAQTVEEAIAEAKRAGMLADVIEIRLDSLMDPELAPFFKEIEKPLLFTNRPVWEGGNFRGEESDRIGLLEEAVKKGAAYVDIELKTSLDLREKILDAAKESTTKIIISWHNFETTPSPQALASVFQTQYRSGANIGKIVTTANDFTDVLRVLDLQKFSAEMDFPLIAFCMGRVGVISRIATVELRGYMTYAAPDSGKRSAPGQLSVSTMKVILQGIADGD